MDPKPVQSHSCYLLVTTTAGAFAVNGDFNNPLWSLALINYSSNTNTLYQAMFRLTPTALVSTNVRSTNYHIGCSVCDPGSIRLPAVAYDYTGESVFLGAPVHFRIADLVDTDFVLEEPPKHTYWDEKAQKVITVSRFPGISTSLTTERDRVSKAKARTRASGPWAAALKRVQS